MENPIKMDDLGVPLFTETSIMCLQWKLFLQFCREKNQVQESLLVSWGLGKTVVFKFNELLEFIDGKGIDDIMIYVSVCICTCIYSRYTALIYLTQVFV